MYLQFVYMGNLEKTSPVVYIFIFSLPHFDVWAVATPINVFLLFQHTKMYTSKMIFTLLDLLFIKNTLISQVVFYLYVYVSD